jgi:hypothetical protein
MRKNWHVTNARIAVLKRANFIGSVRDAVDGKPIHLDAPKN